MRIFITVTLILALGSQWAAGQCYMQKDAETVLLMNFNKASGTLSNGAQVPDESGNNNNGVIVGSGSFRQGAEGKNGLFLREMDYIKIMSSASLSPADEITIEVWASIDKPNVHAILRKKGAYTFPDLQGTNTVKAQIVQTNGVPFNFPAYIAGIKTNDQRARYFAMTFKGKDMAMYFTQNTSPRSHKSMTRTVPLSMTIKQSNGEIWIGKNFPDESYAEHLEGILYSVRISKKARTCQDIQKSHFCDSVAQINECCSNPCKNGGTCKDEHGKHTCDCLTGFKGVNCEDIDECAKKPCLNNGVCTDLINDYRCTCPTGYTGKNCGLQVDDCAKRPCLNNGVCTDLHNDYKCTCTAGFTGKNCGININDCAKQPCLNNGVCTDLINDYRCTCRPGFTGKNCGINIDECQPKPCLNGGLCQDLVNGYKCNCLTGFEGTHCGIPTNHCNPNPCLNQGLCDNSLKTTFRCRCKIGYKGIRCGIINNECSSNPCKHGGHCSETATPGYICSCEPGFTGTNCETQINECASSPCVNGKCIDHVNAYRCVCPKNFGGHRCHVVEVFKAPAERERVPILWVWIVLIIIIVILVLIIIIVVICVLLKRRSKDAPPPPPPTYISEPPHSDIPQGVRVIQNGKLI